MMIIAIINLNFINPPFDQCATYFFIIIHSNKVLVEVLLLLTALAHVSDINSSEYKKVSNKSITKTKNSSLDSFRLFSFVFDALLFIGQKVNFTLFFCLIDLLAFLYCC